MADDKDETTKANLLPEFPPIPYVEAYKPGIDRTLLIENLKLTPGERIARGASFTRMTARIRGSAREARPQ